MNLFIFACLTTSWIRYSISQSGDDFSKLHNDLFKVNPRVRPVKNKSTRTTVNIDFHLMAINSFQTVEQKLNSVGWMNITWRDEYLVWDPKDYGNATLIYPDPDKVWRPKLTIQNTMKDLKPLGEEYVVIQAGNDGTVSWYPAEAFETFCHVDITYFPFDTQTCNWELFVWGVDLLNIDLIPVFPQINVDIFKSNGEWDLVSTHASIITFYPVGNLSASSVVYSATLKRRPTLLVLTVLLPVIVLAVINIFVFFIPFDSGK